MGGLGKLLSIPLTVLPTVVSLSKWIRVSHDPRYPRGIWWGACAISTE